ncbi:MAG: DUF2157 domain-containing protein [Planctomycetota bacterium]|nr:DUF2157 domain-containing protein [Planctomycetota bacterium]
MSEETTTVDLDKIPATRQQVSRLYFAGLLDREARLYAFELLNPRRLWTVWASRLLLILGAALILAGIIFFFAANWNSFSGMVKLGGIEVGLVVCLAGAWLYGLERLSGKVLLLGAGVLVGVFLAVFGQEYQTGADAWDLFAQWSILIFGWVLLARFVPLWGVWLVVTNVAVALFVEQKDIFRGGAEINGYALLAVLNGAVLVARELACSRGVSWLQGKWTRLPLVFAVLWVLLIPVLASIVDYDQEYVFSLLIGLAGGAFMYWFYRFRTRDMWCFSAACLFWALIVEVCVARVVFEGYTGGRDSPLLFMAMVTIGIFAGACWHVMKVLKEPAAETEKTTAAGGEKDV